MEQNEHLSLVRKIMADFAGLTGLSPLAEVPQRYLWTDAFAVCNFLQLYDWTNDEGYKDLALRLVDQVHRILGRHREDDPRTGWISGLDEKEGGLHPTIGGLRIGKEMNERGPGEPLDERLEWDRDGQYYHYLTKWMHALNRVSRVTGDPTFNTWARELAKTVHARFTYVPSLGGRKRMYWKMSIDLTHPLTHSMGQHDPLDGFVTYRELQGIADREFGNPPGPDLGTEIADMATICRGQRWATDDPLGIGGLLFDACRVVQLTVMGDSGPAGLLETILESALAGLESWEGSGSLELPAGYRLAFRELGLAIGLQGVEKMRELVKGNTGSFGRSLPQRIKAFERYVPLAERIEKFWLEVTNREAGSWTEHREINMVMLATSLEPQSFLAM